MDNSTVRRGLVLLVLVTCSILLLWWFVPRGEDRGGYLVTSVTSGEAFTVTRDGETHTVWIEGIVAPAQGACGFEQSRANLAGAIEGATVVLIPDSRAESPSTTDPDQIWSRYVDLDGVDIGLAQIEAGFAGAQDGGYDRGGEYRDAANKAAVLKPYSCP